MPLDSRGSPWAKGYIDLERGRPMYPVSRTGRNILVDSYGNYVSIKGVEVLLEDNNRILSAILLILSSVSDINILKEDI